MTPMLDAALAWAERGFAVLPVEPKGKAPATDLAVRGAYSATRDPDQIRRWWRAEPEANIGIAADHGLILLDVDPKFGGHLSLDELETEFGTLPATLQEVTGPWECEIVAATVRGRHVFFQMPDAFEGEPTGGELRGYPGIDARVHGQYVVVSPSIHPSGTRYELATPLQTEVAIAPDWLLALLPGVARPVQELDIPDMEGVYFPLDEETAARMLKWTWEKYGPNRRETLAHYAYRLFNACCDPLVAYTYMRNAAAVLDNLSPHSERYDSQSWIREKLQVYFRKRNPRPSPWRVRQILKATEGVSHA